MSTRLYATQNCETEINMIAYWQSRRATLSRELMAYVASEDYDRKIAETKAETVKGLDTLLQSVAGEAQS